MELNQCRIVKFGEITFHHSVEFHKILSLIYDINIIQSDKSYYE